jgi:polar amino acid transport system permease protein
MKKIKKMFMADSDGNVTLSKAILNYLIVFLVLGFVLMSSFDSLGLTLDFSFVKEFNVRIMDGFILMLKISAVSLIFSLIIGIVSAVLQISNILFWRYLSKTYVALVRGTPLIMQIYLFFYIIGTAWGLENRFWSGVLILSIFEGAYIAEIIRGSLLAFDQNQIDSAKSVGFSKFQTIRYVIIPQLVAQTLPALTGQFASIIKDSSLLSLIAVIEITQTMREISSINFKLFECYILLGVLYLVVTLPLSLITKYLERRFDYEA